mmetsp:Transcript_20456/g.52059  ORF Transcript_20456/g.52059 Transcript_20456/m.52059 type:complete len:288 (+) Transcript_20456:1518-2381(+)
MRDSEGVQERHAMDDKGGEFILGRLGLFGLCVRVEAEQHRRAVAPLGGQILEVGDALPIAIVSDIGAENQREGDHLREDLVWEWVGEDPLVCGARARVHKVKIHHGFDDQTPYACNNCRDNCSWQCGTGAGEEQADAREGAWINQHGLVCEQEQQQQQRRRQATRSLADDAPAPLSGTMVAIIVFASIMGGGGVLITIYCLLRCVYMQKKEDRAKASPLAPSQKPSLAALSAKAIADETTPLYMPPATAAAAAAAAATAAAADPRLQPVIPSGGPLNPGDEDEEIAS